MGLGNYNRLGSRAVQTLRNPPREQSTWLTGLGCSSPPALLIIDVPGDCNGSVLGHVWLWG